MVRLQFDLNKQYKITLPKAIIEAKGWKKGDELKIALDENGNIVIINQKTNKESKKE
ncbi:MAG: AbrB/MazE/SpoVT family DNA-binding domain-containing protein [Candidatus Woesearchaeota archaeon]|nr:AbrB/MazE/SpoVT family DNA-binding domain-containing protein [Candidatus Woesearchaeota archaeon]